VRELENVIARAVLVCSDGIVRPENLHLDSADDKTMMSIEQPASESISPVGNTLRDVEKTLIYDTLNSVNGNKMQASKILGISVRTIRNKLHEYGYELNDD
jgi:DNA-binding NtrC family response regulator